MPNLIDRARNSIVGVLLGDEKRKLDATMRLLTEAYYTGPYQLPPDILVSQLQEQAPELLQDLVMQLYWEQLGSIGYSQNIDAERARAVAESRRLWKYSPLAQWSISLWTNYGLGESLRVTCADEDADIDWQEFLKADRNAAILADDHIQDLSNKLLVTGERYLVIFASDQDGEATIRKIAPEEIVEIVTHPDDNSVPLFYKRQWTDTKNAQQTMYYPDWKAFFEKQGGISEALALDTEFRDGKTLADYVLPNGAKRADTANEHTAVVVLHIAHNQKGEDELRGWPILAAAAPYIRAHKQFLENRLAISASQAMYVREFITKSGSRGVAAVKSKLASRLNASTYYDTNPPAVPGSSLVHNEAIEYRDLPKGTGAGDAKSDNEIFAWFALLATSLFPTSAGLDTSRWATALAMDKTQSMQWNRYQTFWAAQFRKIVKIILQFKELYGGKKYQSYDATVSCDQFSLVDFPDIVTSLSQMIQSAMTPLVDNGTIPQPTARAILAQLWRAALQALGIADVDKLTSDQAFEIEQLPEETRRAIETSCENYKEGKVTADQLAEYLMAELVENKHAPLRIQSLQT